MADFKLHYSLTSVMGRNTHDQLLWSGTNQPQLTTGGTEGKRRERGKGRQGFIKISNNDENNNPWNWSRIYDTSFCCECLPGSSLSLSWTGSYDLFQLQARQTGENVGEWACCQHHFCVTAFCVVRAGPRASLDTGNHLSVIRDSSGWAARSIKKGKTF